MKEIVVFWYDPNILNTEQLIRLAQQLSDNLGDVKFLLVPEGITRVEVVK